MTTAPSEQEAHPILHSGFAEALHGKAIGVTQADVNELLTGYSVLYRRFSRALKRFLQTLEEYEKKRYEEGWENSTNGSTTDPLDDFLDCIYAAAELFEFYESDVIKSFDPPTEARQPYRSVLARLKREAVLICNRCKHNHAFLQSIEVRYDSGLAVSGFAVYQMDGNRAKVNVEVHRNREAFSFNWAVRRLPSE